MPSILRIALLPALLAFAPVPARACGPDTDCHTGDRTWRIRMPPASPGGARIGAVMLLHGHRDTAANMMAQAALGAALSDAGVALVAPQSAGPGWSLPNGPGGPPTRDEAADMLRIAEDAAARFPIDRGRFLVAGFSAGGMLAWHIACQAGPAFAGYAPLAGTFWAPVPEACPAAPATILHSHGTDDPVVPIAGRAIREARQGDVTEAIRRYAAFGRFGPPVEHRVPGLDCARRSNAEGRVLELCLHPGGHELRAADVMRAWRALVALNGW